MAEFHPDVAFRQSAAPIRNVTNHVNRLAPDERRVEALSFSNAPLTVVSRPGLFALIGRSSKPAAKRFDRWVRHEVLPSIMDTGKYEMPGREEPKGLPGATPAPSVDPWRILDRVLSIFEKVLDETTASTVRAELLPLPATAPVAPPHWSDADAVGRI